MTTPTTEQFIDATTGVLGVSQQNIKSSREQSVVSARQCIMWLMREHTPMSLAEIARPFGTDHSTVCYAVRKFDKISQSDAWWRSAIKSIREALGLAEAAEPKVAELPVVELKPPVVVKPVVTKPKAASDNYRATIRRDAVHPITSADTARVDHRLMWHDFDLWCLRNPIKEFYDAVAAPALAVGRNGKPLGRPKRDRFEPSQRERDILASCIRKTAQDAGITPDELMHSNGSATHPSRRQAISRAHKQGVRATSIAKILGSTDAAVNHALRRVSSDNRLAMQSERMKERAA